LVSYKGRDFSPGYQTAGGEVGKPGVAGC